MELPPASKCRHGKQQYTASGQDNTEAPVQRKQWSDLEILCHNQTDIEYMKHIHEATHNNKCIHWHLDDLSPVL